MILNLDWQNPKIHEKRFCPQCPGMKFKNLEEHADHLATHNCTPKQWQDAYDLIAKARPKREKGLG